MDADTLNDLEGIYGLVTHVYRAKNIRTAEGSEGY